MERKESSYFKRPQLLYDGVAPPHRNPADQSVVKIEWLFSL